MASVKFASELSPYSVPASATARTLTLESTDGMMQVFTNTYPAGDAFEVDGLGDLICDDMEERGVSVGRYSITVEGDTVRSDSYYLIHARRKLENPAATLAQGILVDSPVQWIPDWHAGTESYLVYSAEDTNVSLLRLSAETELLPGARVTQADTFSIDFGGMPRPSVIQAEMNGNRMYISLPDNNESRNCKWLRWRDTYDRWESVAVRAVLTHSAKPLGETVVCGGRKVRTASGSEDTHTLDARGLDRDTALSLLYLAESREVELAVPSFDGPVTYSPITVTSVSGQVGDQPGELCSVKIEFTYTTDRRFHAPRL